MFRHGPELYLIARIDPEGTFQNDRGIEYEGLTHLIDLGKGFEMIFEVHGLKFNPCVPTKPNLERP